MNGNFFTSQEDALRKARADGAQTVSCAADPCDLRPAVTAIMDRIDQAARSLRGKQPIVVIIGETHSMPAHRMLQAQLLERLAKGPHKIAAGFELPHNTLGAVANERFHGYLTGAEKAALGRKDADGQRALMSYLAFGGQKSLAPASFLTLLHFCYQNSIKTRFTDAARAGGVLDSDDPVTGRIIAYNTPEILQLVPWYKIRTISQKGIDLRNQTMAHLAMTYAQRQGADVFIQHAGVEHLFGHSILGGKYENSLTAQFNKAGAHVISVLFAGAGYRIDQIPYEAQINAMKRTLIITDVNNQVFTEETPGENAFLEKISRHSGSQIKIFDPKLCLAERQVLQIQLRRDMPHWIREAKLKP